MHGREHVRRWGGEDKAVDHIPCGVLLPSPPPLIPPPPHTQKRLDDALLHAEAVDNVPYWESAELPDSAVGGILSRVGLAGGGGGLSASSGGDGRGLGRSRGGAATTPFPGRSPKGGSGGRGGVNSSFSAAAPTLTASGAILDAFLQLSAAARLHHSHGGGGFGGGVVGTAAAAAAAAVQQRLEKASRSRPWRPSNKSSGANKAQQGEQQLTVWDSAAGLLVTLSGDLSTGSSPAGSPKRSGSAEAGSAKIRYSVPIPRQAA